METPTLSPLYGSMLAEQLAAEKKYARYLIKISKSVSTQELRHAISPDATEIDNHISRLSRAMAALKDKQKPGLSPVDEAFLKAALSPLKGQSVWRDVQTLHHLRQIFSHKVSRYESLYQMSQVLGLEEYTVLLEQCCKDNQNTVAYLNQIAQNVIYPAVR